MRIEMCSSSHIYIIISIWPAQDDGEVRRDYGIVTIVDTRLRRPSVYVTFYYIERYSVGYALHLFNPILLSTPTQP